MISGDNSRRTDATKFFLGEKAQHKHVIRGPESWEQAMNTRTRTPTRTATSSASPRERRGNAGHGSVSFRESCEVFFVPSSTEMTADEHRATWYGEDEFKGIMANNIRSVREIRRKNNKNEGNNNGCLADNDDQFCTRGIEPLLCANLFKQRKGASRLAISAVLSEQDRQRREAVYDPEKVRMSSTRVSAGTVNRALSYARADAAFVCQELTISGQGAHAKIEPRRRQAAQNLKDALEAALQTLSVSGSEALK